LNLDALPLERAWGAAGGLYLNALVRQAKDIAAAVAHEMRVIRFAPAVVERAELKAPHVIAEIRPYEYTFCRSRPVNS